MSHRRIVGNEAHFYASDRLSPGLGAIRLFPQQNPLLKFTSWMRWWHWTILAAAALLMLDARF